METLARRRRRNAVFAAGAVNTINVNQLEVAWTYDVSDVRARLKRTRSSSMACFTGIRLLRKFCGERPDERIERLRTVDAKELSEQELQRMTQPRSPPL